MRVAFGMAGAPVHPKIVVKNFGSNSETALSQVDIPFTNCGSSTDLLNITRLTSSVWPPVLGQPLTVSGSGSLLADVDAGTFETKVSYLGLPLIEKKGDLGSLTTLPIKAGSPSITQTITLPSSLPPGDYNIQAAAVDEAGNSIGCVGLSFTL